MSYIWHIILHLVKCTNYDLFRLKCKQTKLCIRMRMARRWPRSHSAACTYRWSSPRQSARSVRCCSPMTRATSPPSSLCSRPATFSHLFHVRLGFDFEPIPFSYVGHSKSKKLTLASKVTFVNHYLLTTPSPLIVHR